MVLMLDAHPVGFRFNMWPLHITLLPWFSAPNLSQVEEICADVASTMPSFTVEVGERAYFGGPKRKLAVMKIKEHHKLNQLHYLLRQQVLENEWELMGRYTGERYTPHVTQKRGVDAEGEIRVNEIYIVEGLEQGYRKIVSKVALDG